MSSKQVSHLFKHSFVLSNGKGKKNMVTLHGLRELYMGKLAPALLSSDSTLQEHELLHLNQDT